MTKKIFGTMAVLAVLSFGYYAYNAHQTSNLSNMTLANIEALSNNENPPEQTWQIASKTITIEYQVSNEEGWEWSFSLNAWLFKGEATKNSPKDAMTVRETTTFNCCREKGPEKECVYEEC